MSERNDPMAEFPYRPHLHLWLVFCRTSQHQMEMRRRLHYPVKLHNIHYHDYHQAEFTCNSTTQAPTEFFILLADQMSFATHANQLGA